MTRHYGVATPEQVAGLSGLEILQAMMRGDLPEAPIAALVDFAVLAADADHVLLRGVPDGRFLNPYGTIHAGWISTLLDSAMSLAVLTTLRPGQGLTTLELKVNCVRPILPSTGEVRVTGRVIHPGRQIGTAEAHAKDAQGKLLGHATTTCIVFDRRPGRAAACS